MKLGMLGAGFIVQDALEALEQISQIDSTAIYVRPNSREKAESLAKKFPIQKIYTDYDELLKDPEIDFIYVGLPNGLHYSETKKALLAGKNVILEKPSTTRAAEIEELARIAEEKHLYLFEAVTMLHSPNFHAMKRELKSLGRLKLAQFNYSQYSRRYDSYREGTVLPSFDPKNFGGALYDINIYNLNLAVGLFGEPKNFEYLPNVGFNGVDTSGILNLEFDGFRANCVGAKDSESPSFVIIQGEDGFIRMADQPNLMRSFEVHVRGQESKTINENQFEHRMIHEFIEFNEIFERQDFQTMLDWLKTSVAVIRVAEGSIKKSGLIYG